MQNPERPSKILKGVQELKCTWDRMFEVDVKWRRTKGNAPQQKIGLELVDRGWTARQFQELRHPVL